MGIAARFSSTLHEHLDAHAAWFPVSNTFKLGDYGLIDNGVFKSVGNIREYGIEVASEAGPPTSLDFKSEGTRIVRLVNEAEVNALPDAPIDAKLKIEFGDENSYLAKAAKMTVAQIPNVGQVATRLANADGWRRKYRVVWSTVTGHDAAIVASQARNATLELSGKADALKQVELGSVSAEVSVSSESNVGYHSIGKSGVVGLRLFKLRWYGGDTPKLLGPGEEQEVDLDEAHELEDDL